MTALIHEIVEIDAGDTYAYDTQGLKTQKEREELFPKIFSGVLMIFGVLDAYFTRPNPLKKGNRLVGGFSFWSESDK